MGRDAQEHPWWEDAQEHSQMGGVGCCVAIEEKDPPSDSVPTLSPQWVAG